MYLQIGSAELMLVVTVAAVATILYFLNRMSGRAAAAAIGCFALAALLTPADVVSLAVFAVVLGGMLLGYRAGINQARRWTSS